MTSQYVGRLHYEVALFQMSSRRDFPLIEILVNFFQSCSDNAKRLIIGGLELLPIQCHIT